MKRILVWDSTEEIKTKVIESLGGNFEIEIIKPNSASRKGDLVILDLLSMGTRGLDLCTSIKENPQTEAVSVVCLTDGNSEMAVAGYSAGADDCFPVVTDQTEFLARIRARLRTSKAKPVTKIFAENGLVQLDTINQTIAAYAQDGGDDTVVELTPHEFRILIYLIERKSVIVGRSELMSAAWNEKVNVLPRTIDKHISSLRDKVKGICRIESVRGNGYILNFVQSVTQDLKNF